MKTLGTTTDGNYIVEMSADEHWSFCKVESAINHSDVDMWMGIRGATLTGTDLSPIFKALDDLFEAKISINRLKEYVNFLDGVLGSSL